MTQHVVILGGGTGGTLTANRLRKRFETGELTITVVDQDRDHVYQPGLLFLPFGLAHGEDLVRPRDRQLRKGIDFIESGVDRVDVEDHRVVLEGGRELGYDVLVIATGARLVPDETEGLTGTGWMERVFTFYDLPGATGLEQALRDFEGGRIVVNVVDTLWHAYVGLTNETLNDMADTYNASQDRVRIQVENQGASYEELRRRELLSTRITPAGPSGAATRAADPG